MTSTHWLLGLPFDTVTLEETRARVFEAAESGKQLLLATPNVNFLAMASRDAQFRHDVLNTGLSIADGMPVIWIGRMLGVPFKGRVAGSDLLDSLIAKPGSRPLRVYFFGGEAGAAEAAAQAVNRRSGGLVAVGAHNPGFVSIAAMSTEEIIDAINRSEADLLVLALGAAKGHRWMETNRHRLKAPVLCHLGAAVNFVAGKLTRAPALVQKLGLEWLWRIKEEPVLYARYAKDGLYLLRALAGFAIPEWFRQTISTQRLPAMNVTAAAPGHVAVSVTSRFGEAEIAALQGLSVAELTLTDVSSLDAAGVGWIYAGMFRKGKSGLKFTCDAASSASLRAWRAEMLNRETVS